jgi:hypothetical protein
MIQTDDQMLLAQQCIGNLRRVLLEARRTHSRQDYMRLAEPILLEIQAREQEILEYLSRELWHLGAILAEHPESLRSRLHRLGRDSSGTSFQRRQPERSLGCDEMSKVGQGPRVSLSRPSRAAVSAVMPRFPFTIGLMRFAGTRIACAKPLMLICSSFRSSSRILPG